MSRDRCLWVFTFSSDCFKKILKRQGFLLPWFGQKYLCRREGEQDGAALVGMRPQNQAPK